MIQSSLGDCNKTYYVCKANNSTNKQLIIFRKAVMVFTLQYESTQCSASVIGHRAETVSQYKSEALHRSAMKLTLFLNSIVSHIGNSVKVRDEQPNHSRNSFSVQSKELHRSAMKLTLFSNSNSIASEIGNSVKV